MHLEFVVPCYNEEEVLPTTASRLLDLASRMESDRLVSRATVLFVDDGSSDRTWMLISDLARRHPTVRGMKLSRNYGHQAALLAGLVSTVADVAVSLDADLQDDVEVIPRMVESHLAGNEVVFGVRQSRTTDSFFKRQSALAYYRILEWFGVRIVPNHADFRLMGRRSLEVLKEYGESNLFLRGIIPHLGFKSSIVTYDRAARFAGVTKYPLRKMMGLAADGITSFSVTPLRFISVLGIVVFIMSLILASWVLYIRMVSIESAPGWASTVIPLAFLSGVQLLSLGVIGEYLAKIYLETKRRPRFVVEQTVGVELPAAVQTKKTESKLTSVG